MKIKRIDYSNTFVKDLRKAPKKVRIAFRQRLEIYLSNEYHPIINNYSLKGRYEKHRSINITGDWRAIFRKLEHGSIVYFDPPSRNSPIVRSWDAEHISASARFSLRQSA